MQGSTKKQLILIASILLVGIVLGGLLLWWSTTLLCCPPKPINLQNVNQAAANRIQDNLDQAFTDLDALEEPSLPMSFLSGFDLLSALQMVYI